MTSFQPQFCLKTKQYLFRGSGDEDSSGSFVTPCQPRKKMFKLLQSRKWDKKQVVMVGDRKMEVEFEKLRDGIRTEYFIAGTYTAPKQLSSQ